MLSLTTGNIFFTHVSPGCLVVRALKLRLRKSRVQVPALRFQVTTLGKLFTHTRASVTKQCDLVAVRGRWCPAAGKVTVGLTSHWASQTSVVYPPTGSWPKEGRWAPRLHSSWDMPLLYLYQNSTGPTTEVIEYTVKCTLHWHQCYTLTCHTIVLSERDWPPVTARSYQGLRPVHGPDRRRLCAPFIRGSVVSLRDQRGKDVTKVSMV